MARSKQAIKFTSQDAKIIFNYWQRLGYPFVKHAERQSKVTSKGVRLIEKHLKKYSKTRIINCIETCRALFNAPWFKYRQYYASRKLTLPSFFRYEQSEFSKISRKGIPRSWFIECKRPLSKLEVKYSVRRKSKHPKIMEVLKDIWTRYTRERSFSVNTENTLTIAGEELYNFAIGNNLDIFMILETIDKMINENKSYQPKHAGWLKTNHFIQDRLPQELLKSNIIDKNDKEGLVF